MCLEAIVEWAENQNVKLAGFKWSPDGSKVSFVHWNYETHNNGVCYFELAIEEIFCPVNSADLQLDSQMFPYSHFWSPDGRYLALFINPQELESDDGTSTSVAVVNSDGHDFRVLGRAIETDAINENQVWRPSIPSPSEE